MNASIQQKVFHLIADYRDRCLWFVRPDYLPETDDEACRILRTIERYGDREAFRRAEELLVCLSPSSSKAS